MKLLRASGAFALLLMPIDFPEWMAQALPAPSAPNRTIRGQVSKNATLAGLLGDVVSRPRIHDLVETARPVYDLKRLATGHPYGVAVRSDGRLEAFSYGIDDLKTLRVRRVSDKLEAEIVERQYDVKIETASGKIRSSLFGAIEDAGEQDQLAIDLAEIFAWDVDFNTELQKGDAFKVSVEKLSLDGRFVRYGRILAAELRNTTRTLQAVRFEASRGPGYYAPDGKPLRKEFLRSPLKFTRISSGFTSARFHPILGVTTAHFGIDYAAPTGTPVNASADGVVTLAGVSAGLGNTVKLRHANGFETQYGHLSQILARPGQRVVQGAPIGLVGSTGLSTGPHLHYIMFKNGGYANPLKVQLPPAEPIPDDERDAFESSRAVAMHYLTQAPAAPQLALADAAVAAARSARSSSVRRQ
jgi:murein DD-endopeptidase MepM/ murein hydrolase activator NlpD